MPVVIAPRIGAVAASDGVDLHATASLENSAPVLFDALVLPDGDDAIARLMKQPQTMAFVNDTYHHGKTLLLLGDAASKLLAKAGIEPTLPTGEPDPGAAGQGSTAVAIAAVPISSLQWPGTATPNANWRTPWRRPDPQGPRGNAEAQPAVAQHRVARPDLLDDQIGPDLVAFPPQLAVDDQHPA